MSKVRIAIAALFAVVILLSITWNWTLFLSDPAYVERVFGIKLPESTRVLRTVRMGTDSPLLECYMDLAAFTKFKEVLSIYGFREWSAHSYAPERTISLLSAVTVAGTKKGCGSTLVQGRKAIGNTSIYVYYDTLTGTLLALKRNSVHH